MSVLINLKDAQTVLMKKSLYEFVKEMWDSYETSPFSDCWLIEYLCECFEYSIRHFLPKYCWGWWIGDKEYNKIKEETGGICPVRDFILPDGSHARNHDLNIAPRHTKSSIFNVLGPAWAIINTPITVVSVSHSLKLSGEMIEKKQKLFNSDKYKYYFGNDIQLKLRKNTADHLELFNGGKTYSIAMDKFTGFGADCFVAGTQILTERGIVSIEELRIGDRVLSYNERAGVYEYSNVVATRRIEDREVGIAITDSGRRIECTPDHRFWVEDRGYQEISKIEEGSKFRICELQSVRKNDIRLERVLQKLLRKVGKNTDIYEMQSLWKGISEFFDVLEKASRENRVLLFKELSIESEQRQEEILSEISHLSTMWEDWSSKYSEVLFSGMQKDCRSKEEGNSEQKDRCILQELWKIISDTCKFKKTVLFGSMCSGDEIEDNNWREQSKLQGMLQFLLTRIFGDEAENIGARFISMSMLWREIEECSVLSKWKDVFKAKFNYSPQRQEYIKQFTREFSDIVHELSYKYSQERLREWEIGRERKTVYDIQVEPNNNFFANGVLVHNCIINDDLISVADARRDGAVLLHARDYFKTTMPSRLNNKTTGVIWHIMQRIGLGDISDLINEDKGLRQIYSHTELQAIATHDQTFIYPCSGKVKEIKKGDLLWEERFGDYSQLMMEIGREDFETQYNQQPSKSRLNVIQDEYIHWIDEEEYEEFKLGVEFHYGSHDCPVKDKETSDFHGFVEGESRENELVITDAFEEHLSYIKEKELMTNLQIVDPAIIQIVEDKANGAALLQDLSIDVSGLVPFNPGTRSKTQRLELASIYMQQGLVRFRKTERVEELVMHLKKFPLLAHDDDVDAFSQLVIYHFTQRHLGVYSGAFNYQNIVLEKPESRFHTYGATMNGETIKVVEVDVNNSKDLYTVTNEWKFSDLQSFEDFCRTLIPGCTVYDASPKNRLSSLITSVYNVLKFEEQDRDKSISILKTGFLKKKVLVSKDCKQTINDIARMRFTDAGREKGIDATESFDEGMSGCLRAVITSAKGYSQVWY